MSAAKQVSGPLDTSFWHADEDLKSAWVSEPFAKRGECSVWNHSPLVDSNALQVSTLPAVRNRDARLHSVDYAQKRLGPEAQLVQRFCRWLDRHDVRFCRLEIWSPESGAVLKTDLFCPESQLLLEAKANINRESLRAAIGQLADYVRFLPDAGTRLGILVPRKPKIDLIQLLASYSIACVYEGSDGKFRLARATGGSACFAPEDLKRPYVSPTLSSVKWGSEW